MEPKNNIKKQNMGRSRDSRQHECIYKDEVLFERAWRRGREGCDFKASDLKP